MMKLSEIADVRLGVNAKVRNTGEVQLVTNAAIQPFGAVDPEKIQKTDFDGKLRPSYEKHLLKEGDVLLIGKGKEHIAAIWEPRQSGALQGIADPSMADPKQMSIWEGVRTERGGKSRRLVKESATLAAATLFVVRVKPGAVKPTFLAAFLNSPMAQSYFTKHAKRGTVSILGKEAVEDLEIYLPDSPEKVTCLAVFYEAQREYQTTLAELHKAQEALTNRLLDKHIKSN